MQFVEEHSQGVIRTLRIDSMYAAAILKAVLWRLGCSSDDEIVAERLPPPEMRPSAPVSAGPVFASG